MRGRPTSVVGVVVCALLAACGAADNRVDPADLALRDLLGLAPQVALAWDDGQRAAARRVLGDALADAAAATDDAAAARPLVAGRTPEERVVRTLAVADGDRAGRGDAALALVHVVVGERGVTAAARAATTAATATLVEHEAAAPPLVELWLAPGWDAEPRWSHLPGRGLDVLAALAADAGHTGGPVVIAPAPRLAVAAAYVAAAGDDPAELLINPVLLAALPPDPLEVASAAALTRAPAAAGALPALPAGAAARPVDDRAAPPLPAAGVLAGTGGNPYSFYGSVAECAYAQRTRCETCLASSTCAPVTDLTDGNAECTMLGAASGRGYFLLCINLSLAIASVDACVADEAPACPRDPSAASSLATLELNARFLDDPACAPALDVCLADIYGAPGQPFPGPDGGVAPGDPRSTEVACGDACDSSSNNGNCESNPSCGDGSGPSCNNAFSCDSACSSSNEQSGCGGNCEACNASGDSGGSTSAGCGGCESEPASGSGGSSCGSCDDGSSSGSDSGCGSSSESGGSSCGSCNDSSSSSGCGGDGGGCGGGSGGGNSCGSGGGGSSGSCNVARRGPPASLTLLFAGLWALLPLPAAALVRRRARRRRRPDEVPARPPADRGGDDGEVA